eukprot:426245_1
MSNNTYNGTLQIIDETVSAYEGANYDAFSIILTIILIPSFLVCCSVKIFLVVWTRNIEQNESNKPQPLKTKEDYQRERERQQLEQENKKKKSNILNKMWWITLWIFLVALTCEGLNLQLRYINGQCDYSQQECQRTVVDQRTKIHTYSKTYSDKDCSEECLRLKKFGLTLLITGLAFIFMVFGYYAINRHCNDDDKKNNK